MTREEDAEVRRRRLGRAIARFREEHGLTPHVIYRKEGPDPRTQAKIEAGEYVYPASLRKLAEASGWKYESRLFVEQGVREDLEPVEPSEPPVPPEDPGPPASIHEMESLLVRVSSRLPAAQRREVLEVATRLAQDNIDRMTREFLE